MKPRFATIEADVSTVVGGRRQHGGDLMDVVVDGVQLAAACVRLHAAIVDKPHRPHGVRLFLALEDLVPVGHDQAANDRSHRVPAAAGSRDDAGVPVLEADPDVGARSEAPRADQRVEKGGAVDGRRCLERVAAGGPDESLALEGEAGQVAPVGVEATRRPQPAVGERRQTQVVLEQQGRLRGRGVTRSPRRHPLSVDADVPTVDVDSGRTVTPAKAARRQQRRFVDRVVGVAVYPDLQRSTVAIQFQIVHRTALCIQESNSAVCHALYECF